MSSRSRADPWSDFNLSNSGVFNTDKKSSIDNNQAAKKTEVPFYVSQFKTSAEIIEEAKANMTKQSTFPAIR